MEINPNRWNNIFRNAAIGDIQGSMFAWERLAREGSVAALNQMAKVYEFGCEAISQDLDKARSLYESGAAQGSIESIRALGRIYFVGNGVEVDYSKSKEYYELLVQEDDMIALHAMGLFHLNGLATPTDRGVAMQYFRVNKHNLCP